MHILIKNNKLFYNEYKMKCAIGKNGIGYKKEEGDKITPIGSYKILYILYRRDRITTLNTKIKKIPIKKNMGWCDDPKSKKYNKLIKIPFKFSAERLFIKKNIYDIILVLNFNINPTISNKGSAIFLHVADKKYKKTLGCVAVKKKDLKNILKKISKKTKIIIS